MLSPSAIIPFTDIDYRFPTIALNPISTSSGQTQQDCFFKNGRFAWPEAGRSTLLESF
jgi:hypothetical protein